MRKINKVEEERFDRSKIISSLEESLPRDIIEWFEGPTGFDNNEVNLRGIIDAYKEVLDYIEPYQIFADF